MQDTYQLSLSFDQILALVKQLSDAEKLRLSQELEKDTRSQKLTQLLESFQTDKLPLETIKEETEVIRAELHARQQAH